jgi:cobalt-zinc-cadmium efflux system protein
MMHNHHAPPVQRNEKRAGLAALLTGSFMVAELIGGYLSGSLALLADAGHMVTDFASLSLAWLGFRLARRPADWKRTYGFDRFSVLIAFVNGVALFVVALWIVVEAVHRLSQPNEVLAGLMLGVALAGLAVNIACFFILRGGDQDNLNMRAAILHVTGDLLGSVAAIAAAIVIMTTGWVPIDPLLSVLVALIILRSAWQIVRDSGHMLLEGTPEGLDVREVRETLQREVPFVEDIHHVHAGSVSAERPMVTLHAKIVEGADVMSTTASIKRVLAVRFEISHATVEIEHDNCADHEACRETVFS